MLFKFKWGLHRNLPQAACGLGAADWTPLSYSDSIRPRKIWSRRRDRRCRSLRVCRPRSQDVYCSKTGVKGRTFLIPPISAILFTCIVESPAVVPTMPCDNMRRPVNGPFATKTQLLRIILICELTSVSKSKSPYNKRVNENVLNSNRAPNFISLQRVCRLIITIKYCRFNRKVSESTHG